VKNVIIGDTSQTFARKFQEAALAMRVERRFSKDEILELYLNDVYFGNGAYGIERPPRSTSQAGGRPQARESALLARRSAPRVCTTR